jgi:hypothetical protein
LLSLLALSGIASSSYVFYQARWGHDDQHHEARYDDRRHEARYFDEGWFNESGKHERGNNGDVHGAPGPIAGAGLPALAVGYGIYWLMRRRRKTG